MAFLSIPTITAATALPFLPRTAPTTARALHKKATGTSRLHSSSRSLEPLYDDGYGDAVGVGDYLDAAADLVGTGHGPLRWLCPVDCGPPLEGSPVLLFLPGIAGVGMELFMHHKALKRIFEVRCMHVPFMDCTPFSGLMSFVEDEVRLEHSTCQSRPVYLLGHSFGACLALSVAARNPHIDLIVILSNPATSFGKSHLQPLFSLFRSSFYQLNVAVPLFLSVNIDNYVKTLGSTRTEHNPLRILDNLSRHLLSPLLQLSNFLDNVSNEAIEWKIKLLKSAACYSNSRLHAVKAEVLILSSGLDNLLPSRDEGERLGKLLPNCKVYYFENHGHNILMERGFQLSTVIRIAGLYRHTRQHDFITDFIPPTMSDIEALDKTSELLYLASSPVMFSTMEDGKIVRGLSGVPNDGPVLLVGNHMLLGLEMIPFFREFLREKGILVRGIGHPVLFQRARSRLFEGRDFYDFVRLLGGVPVSFRYLYKLLAEKSFVLLYPGGTREALHRKGEEYKLFWPPQPEFVRMAAKFGATIVPFGAVGEDDLTEILLDYDDLMAMPLVREEIKESNRDTRLKHDGIGVRDQDIFLPWCLPRIPGRIYYLFGKPITMVGREEVLKDREAANAMYSQVKSEIERSISYLLKKREEDDYRSLLRRTLYRTARGSSCPIPTFEP